MLYRLINNRNFPIMLLGDAGLVLLSYFVAYWIRFDGVIPASYLTSFFHSFFWIVPLKLGAFLFFDLYKGMWRYTSIHDMLNIVKATVGSSVGVILVVLLTYRFHGFSRGIFVIDLGLTFLLISGFRVCIRLFFTEIDKRRGFAHIRRKGLRSKKIIIVGAGSTGEKLYREIQDNRELRYDLVGFVDDNPQKYRQTLHGVPVLGHSRDIPRIAAEYEVDEIIIAMPSSTATQMRSVVNFCKVTDLPFKTVPGIGELLSHHVSISSVREVNYADLLGREPTVLDLDAIGGYLTGKRVLVTGGAGSIGSELCNQVAKFHPATLILAERNESGLYEKELELLAANPGLHVSARLGPIQNRRHMDNLFAKERPQVVFHAAAYKHVPLMELHPWEAVFNNIVGTRALMELCRQYQVERCVIVSTDKAVRPTNVMGASKRVVEKLMQSYREENGTLFMAVRFGNVVGSIGSVIPLFRRQVEKGGPVTVTHPEMTRFFMTIPEAAGLILQAGALGEGGEIFVLKMGTPVRILDMARDIISLSGYKPYEDIDITFVGLRPGEKLYEELILDDEGIQKTRHEDVMVLSANGHHSQTTDEINALIDRLVELARVEDGVSIKRTLQELVPEYTPDW